MTDTQVIQLGDVIRKGDRTYDVEGWTRRGKLKLRTPTGTTRTCWWYRASDLPKHYELWRGQERIR